MINVADAAARREDGVVRELREAGLRVTMARQAVLTWITAHPHATADAVAEGVRGEFGALSRQAVYDVLAVCTQAGLLQRTEPAGHPARFERRVGDKHHHLVCRACGRTEDTDCAVGERACLEPVEELGFVVDEAEVVFWGLCPACKDRRLGRRALVIPLRRDLAWWIRPPRSIRVPIGYPIHRVTPIHRVNLAEPPSS